MEISQIEIIECDDLETLDRAYNKFKGICDRYKDTMGDRFTYKLDPNYDKLELNVTLNFEQEDDDYSEGNSQLN